MPKLFLVMICLMFVNIIFYFSSLHFLLGKSWPTYILLSIAAIMFTITFSRNWLVRVLHLQPQRIWPFGDVPRVVREDWNLPITGNAEFDEVIQQARKDIREKHKAELEKKRKPFEPATTSRLKGVE